MLILAALAVGQKPKNCKNEILNYDGMINPVVTVNGNQTNTYWDIAVWTRVLDQRHHPVSHTAGVSENKTEQRHKLT